MSITTLLEKKFTLYKQLIRADKPIGSLLLLWPTLWGLWIASDGQPAPEVLVIFILGVFLTRSAGCILNDLADRHVDGAIRRTANRPLATKQISVIEALIVAAVLLGLALLLVLCLNRLTVILAFVGVGLMAAYPLMKRFSYFPQVFLGIAFSWSIPMAFAAQRGTVPMLAWFVFLIAALWPVAYDTMYAMVDRDDDLKVGIKSLAIWLGRHDLVAIAGTQLLILGLSALLGLVLDANVWFYSGLLGGGLFNLYQLNLLKNRQPEQCFKAFLNNHYFGASVFIGLFLNYLPTLGH